MKGEKETRIVSDDEAVADLTLSHLSGFHFASTVYTVRTTTVRKQVDLSRLF